MRIMDVIRSQATAVVLCAVVAGSARAQQIEFSPPAAYSVGTDPRGTSLADLNGDGRLDVVTANEGSGNISILLADGVGGFLDAQSKGGVVNPLTVALSDFNEDGRPDIAVPSRGTGNVAVFLNLGDGTFADAQYLAAGAEPFIITSADLDLDGHADLAVTNVQGASVSLFFGDGSGGFTTAPAFTVGGGPHGMVATDLNEDGAPDLAVVNAFFGTVAVCLNDGTGQFPTVTHTPVGSYPAFVAVGDFAEDGHVDLAILDAGRSELSVWAGDGAGGLSLVTVIEDCGYFAPGDFDQDGHVDLAATSSMHEADRPLVIWQGDGTGQFVRGDSFAAGACANDLSAADTDGDGLLDVVLADTCPDFVLALRNQTHDATLCAGGTVNAAVGDPVDVLFVNGSAGEATRRTVIVNSAEPFVLWIDVPPSRLGDRAAFVLYGWLGRPEIQTRRIQPAGLGTTCMPTPLNRTGGTFDQPQPREIWKNIPRHPELGAATRPSSRAPSTVLNVQQGLGATGTFFLQGFILDEGAPNGIAAITNGIVVESE